MRWLLLLALAAAVGHGLGAPSSRAGAAERERLWLFHEGTAASVIEARIRAQGGEPRVASGWLNAVSADIRPGAARRIKGVTHIQRVRKLYAQTPNPRPGPSPEPVQDTTTYGPNLRALRDLGITQAHALGYTARSIRIAIIDTGFEPAHSAFAGARVVAQRDFINRDNNVANEPGDPATARDQEIHGTWVWSILGGNRPGQIVGPAYEAEFVLAKVDIEQVGNDDFAADEDRWVAAVEWAVDTLGAKVVNSSLGYRDFLDKEDYTPARLNGDIALSTVVADRAARSGAVVVTAMGNFGPAFRSLVAPADGDSLIAVGAVDSLGNVHPQSSRGPSGDGRIKPELVARGVNVYAAAARAPDAFEVVSFGTSLATPFVAGGAAMFMQAWPGLSSFAVRQALILSASNVSFPDSIRGYGLPNIASAIVFPQGLLTAGVATINLSTSALTTIAPTFSWTAPLILPTARPRYQLELARDPTFANIIYSDTVSSAFTLQVKRPLLPSQIWWRVTAEVFPGIRRTTATAGPITMPDWVTLTVLNDVRGSIVNTVRPEFQWEPLAAPPPAGPLVYDLQVLASTGQVVQTVRNLMTARVQLPEPLTPNLSYRWRVIARSAVGVADTVESRGVFVVTSSTLPPTTQLYAPFPNPFPREGVREIRFWFDISEKAVVDLAIYDLRGRLIKRLIPAAPACGSVELSPGQYGRGPGVSDPCQLPSWDGRDLNGRQVPRGVYLARLTVAGRVYTQRILYTP